MIVCYCLSGDNRSRIRDSENAEMGSNRQCNEGVLSRLHCAVRGSSPVVSICLLGDRRSDLLRAEAARGAKNGRGGAAGLAYFRRRLALELVASMPGVKTVRCDTYRREIVRKSFKHDETAVGANGQQNS
jgi:hypothetical protein